jgi:ACS family tartrate transporter-like MFS transporter
VVATVAVAGGLPGAELSSEERAVIRKAVWRLLPFLCFLYFIAYLDRVNVGFAALTMKRDLAMSDAAFGAGAGIFFIAYFLFEVPSNFALKRFGARMWIARIMVTWGIISMAMAFVGGTTSFYVLRFLLGVAEAGFFPGMILYLTFWFPNRVRAGILGVFIIANPASTIIGAPLSTMFLDKSLFGFSGWQTMFLVEGLPAVLLGIAVLFVLCDSPAKAKWLTERERGVLQRAVERDHRQSTHTSLRDGLASPQVMMFSLLYTALMMGVYGFGYWAPQIVKSLGNVTDQQVGLLLVIPYAFATLAMVLWGRHSDRTGERKWHLALPPLVATIGFLVGGYADNLYLALFGFTLGAIGIYASLPLFWSLSTAILGGTAAAGGIALINSIGNLSGFTGPYMMGLLKASTKGYTAGLMVIAASLALAGVMGYIIGRRSPKPG